MSTTGSGTNETLENIRALLGEDGPDAVLRKYEAKKRLRRFLMWSSITLAAVPVWWWAFSLHYTLVLCKLFPALPSLLWWQVGILVHAVRALLHPASAGMTQHRERERAREARVKRGEEREDVQLDDITYVAQGNIAALVAMIGLAYFFGWVLQ